MKVLIFIPFNRYHLSYQLLVNANSERERALKNVLLSKTGRGARFREVPVINKLDKVYFACPVEIQVLKYRER